MARAHGAILALFLTGATQAQADRVLLFVDGRGEELVTIHGRGRWIQDPARVRVGVASLRVEPVSTEKYPGFSVSNVPTRGAKSLVLGVLLEGGRPQTYRVRVDDDKSDGNDDVAIAYETLAPGWNDVVVPLTDRTTTKGRPMAFPTMVRRIQFTKKYDKDDAPLVFDAVMARGAPPPADRRAFLDRYAAEKDLSRRVTLLKQLDSLADQDVATIALEVLAREEQPRLRRVAREELARIATPAVGLEVADAALRAAPALRAEILWAVAAMPCRETRQRAISWIRDAKDAKVNATEKTALVTGLRLAGGSDVRALIDVVPPTAPWPIRAALVNAIRAVLEPESVDALIAILADPGSPRVAEDAETALGVMTGGDYGADAAAWRDWWRVNRDKVELATKPRARQGSYGKATFYGLAVPQGRIAFVIDTSGSMAEPVGGGKLAEYMKTAGHLSPTGIRSRLDLALAEVGHAVSNMKDRSAAAVISFAATADWHTKGFETITQEVRAKIGERVHRLVAGRSTNVYGGLFAAFHPEGKPRPQDLVEGPDTIFLMTDGNPSSGKYTDFDDLRDEVQAWNLGRSIRINCVNVGDTDARLLRALAYGSGGVFLDLKSDKKEEEQPK
jgi:hypothetical protein